MRLERLGLFLGVGEDQNGFTNFDLNRTPSREEAVTMLVRALGKGSEAVGMAKSHPFTDVRMAMYLTHIVKGSPRAFQIPPSAQGKPSPGPCT